MSLQILDYDPPRRWAAASVAGGLVFTAGETGTDPATGQTVPGGVEAQAEQAYRNLASTLDRLGLSLADIARMTVYLTDIGDLHAVSAVRARVLGRPIPSSTVQVCALARPDLVVEVDAIAVVSSGT